MYLQFLGGVIIIKPKVHLLMTLVTLVNFCHYFSSFSLLAHKDFLFGFPVFWPWACLMEVAPETRRAH